MIPLYALASVSIISLVSFVGVLVLLLKRTLLDRSVFVLVSIAVGALLGDVFIHIIPESYDAFAEAMQVSLLIVAGILAFFILEKFLHWHHHTSEHAEAHPHHIGSLTLVSDGVHNFIDGLIVAASYFVSLEVGLATTLAVILHEIPQEIGNFGVLLQSGYSIAKALWFNFLSALTAILGALVALSMGADAERFAHFLLPLTAGGFIYVALSDLIPELHKDTRVGQSLIQVAGVVFGVALMASLLLLE